MTMSSNNEHKGISWPATVVLLMVGLLVLLCTAQAHANNDSIRALIQQAGNTDSDQARLDYLKQLRKQPDLDASLKGDLDKLIAQIERWQNEKRLDYFGGEVKRNKDFDFKIAETSTLYPLTWLYRGRMVIWYAMESGGVWSIPERRREFFAIARGFFEKYAGAFPENKIARMYLGHPTGPYKYGRFANRPYESVPGAPAWAVYQREGLERLSDIIEWWIDNRMQEDGQYGGGWGDDCEMWRWWVPVLIGFDSPKITAAQARFSKALMNQPHMKSGYTTRMSDVEHTAEDSADAITPMMHLDPENAEALRINFEGYTSEVRYTDRVLRFPSLFTGNGILGEPVATIRRPDPSLLYSMVTGDPGDALYFPLNAVRWLTPPRDIAVLVTESTAGEFSAELFGFGQRQRSMSAEFYLLEPGRYKLTITAGDSGGRQSPGTYEFVVKNRRTRVDFKLPPRKLCVLQIRRQ